MNSGRNSRHVQTAALDNWGKEWSLPDDDEVGLCAACFIDSAECHDTHSYRCECRSERCATVGAAACRGSTPSGGSMPKAARKRSPASTNWTYSATVAATN